jgi:hypothetical protein
MADAKPTTVEHDNLADALAAARVEFDDIVKETKGQVGNQKYMYADLATVNDATKNPLFRHGLCITSKTRFMDGQMVMETSLIHGKSKEREICIWPLVSGTQQQIGSAATYARRYSICALINVVGETDDGGKAGSQTETKVPGDETVKPFELMNAWGETNSFARGGEYLAAFEEAFKDAPDKAGFWETNQKHFAEWQVKFKGKPAGEKFNQVGRWVTEQIAAAEAPE